MARPKRSLSDLLDVDQGRPASEPAARIPTMLAVAPALPVDQQIKEPAPIVEVIGEPEAPPEAAAPQDVAELPSITDPAAGVVAEQPSAPTAPSAEKPARSRTPSPVRLIKAAPEPPPLPLYLELTRKEARFRQDQLNDLTTLTRQLNRRRASTGERITDNTLIRVAVDMMLKVADSLDGATEAELLQAVSAKLKR